jgi:hypothetical protein
MARSCFIASRICVDRAVDLRNTLRYLGVHVRHRDVMFGDNESVVNSSMRLDATLHKRHNALSFHRVREAIAAGYIGKLWSSGEGAMGLAEVNLVSVLECFLYLCRFV